MITVLVHRDGVTREADQVDPAWLDPHAVEQLWVDITSPGDPERRLLSDVFHLHELAVEDAMAELHYPKIEAYDGLLYLILHRIVGGEQPGGFDTRDVDFFLGRNFLITVHQQPSRSIEAEREVCRKHALVLSEGPAAVLHRVVERMVDHYRPNVDALEDRIEALEQAVFEQPSVNPLRELLSLKTDVGSLRRVALPQRDAIGRLARREFPQISETLAYRFRDVYDSLVRITDEAILFQDRITGLLDAHVSMQSNRLNQVMKVLTVIATIFMPLTVLTGLYGMNVVLPGFPGGATAQFWWIAAIMVALSTVMLWLFRRMRWL